MLLKFGRIGHREGGTIDEERPVSAPEALPLGIWNERLDQVGEHAAEDGQGQPRSCLAVGQIGEQAAGLEGDVIQRRVAVEDLKEEPMDDGEWGQESVTPDVTGLLAHLMNRGPVEMTGKVLPKPGQRGINPSMHPRASGRMGCVIMP
jgi:hypothetical protein